MLSFIFFFITTKDLISYCGFVHCIDYIKKNLVQSYAWSQKPIPLFQIDWNLIRVSIRHHIQNTFHSWYQYVEMESILDSIFLVFSLITSVH